MRQIITATVSKPAVCMAATNIAKRGRELYKMARPDEDSVSHMSGSSGDKADKWGDTEKMRALSLDLKRRLGDNKIFAERAFYA